VAQFVMRKRRASCSALPSNTLLTAALSMTAVPWCGLLCVVLCRAPPRYHFACCGAFFCYIYTMYPYGFPIHKFTRILKLQNTPDPLPHTTHSLAELSNTDNGR